MELFLHIGAHRTGTSALQELLYSNRTFAGDSWYYPSTGLWTEDRSHNLLATYFWDDVRPELQTKLFDDYISDLFAEISGHNKVIISAEMFEKVPLRGSRARIAEFVSKIRNRTYDLRVIYVVRRQDCLIDSIFKQWVVDVNTRYCGRPIDLAVSESPHLVFSSIIDSWIELVGAANIFIVPYIETRPVACIESVLKILGLDLHPALQERISVNRSLEGLPLEIKHFLNSYPCDPSTHAQLVSTLFALQTADPPERKTSIFSPLRREAFMLSFAQDNLRIRRHFPDRFDEWSRSATVYNTFRTLDLASVERQLLHFSDISPYLFSLLRDIVDGRLAPTLQTRA